MSEFRKSTVTGVGWVVGERVGRSALQFLVMACLARLLDPQDFGLVGMILVFTGFAGLFSDFGLSAALVQREVIEERHYSSVFWVNVGIGVALAALLSVLAPLIAAFYTEPRLTSMTRVVALGFVFSSLSTVQRARLQRAMDFRLLTKVELLSAGGAGAVAVGVALAGGGVWSLIWEGLAASCLAAVIFWLVAAWRPRFMFDRKALADLFWFGGNLLGFSVLNYWIRNVDKMLIGKVMGSAKLGIYGRAYSLMLLPLTQITSVLSRVMFPAMSRIQKDPMRVKRVFLRTVAAIALITFPMMLGALVTAEHIVLTVYGPQWLSAVPVFKILCLLGMLQSIVSSTGWIYLSQGRTDWFFWWGAGAGVLLIGSIVLGVWLGTIEAVAACYTLMSGVILLYPAIAIPGRLVGLRFGEVAAAVSPTLACSVAMATVVLGVGLIMPVGWPHWLILCFQVPVGIAVYGLLLHVFRLTAYLDVRRVGIEHLEAWLPSRAKFFA